LLVGVARNFKEAARIQQLIKDETAQAESAKLQAGPCREPE
jgi:hypothetical protein